jgi:hypothetical protein
MPSRKDDIPNAALKKLPPRIKKRVNVTIETIMEPQFERDEDDDEGVPPAASRRRSSNG